VRADAVRVGGVQVDGAWGVNHQIVGMSGRVDQDILKGSTAGGIGRAADVRVN